MISKLTVDRSILESLKNDFYACHQNIVTQMSIGMQELKAAVDTRSRVRLADVDSPENSQLRLIAGQQDLQENLDHVERNYRQAIVSGESHLANNMRRQLSQQQATSQTLLQGRSNGLDPERMQLIELVSGYPISCWIGILTFHSAKD